VTARPDVLIDVTPLALGSRYQGIGAYIVELTKALALLSDEERGGLAIAALADWRGGRPLVAPLAEASEAVGEWPGAAYSDRGFVWRRRRELGPATRRAGARLVHLPEPLGMPLFPGCPRVVTCHDLIPLLFIDLYARRNPRLVRLRRLAHELVRYHGARRVVAISEATKRDLRRLLRVPPGKIDVVPNGIDLKFFTAAGTPDERAALERQYGLDRPYVLYVGSGDPRKNLPLLVEAFAAAGIAEGTLLALAGKLNPVHAAAVEAAIERCGARRAVRLLGYVPDERLPALYRGALAFALPSVYEGFGLPILEAMACGAPVVTTDGGALAEVAGGAALTVPAGDAAAWTAALRRAAADDAWRSRASDAGLAQAARFSWRACARGTAASFAAALR